jgi:hypothetical protein
MGIVTLWCDEYIAVGEREGEIIMSVRAESHL